MSRFTAMKMQFVVCIRLGSRELSNQGLLQKGVSDAYLTLFDACKIS